MLCLQLDLPAVRDSLKQIPAMTATLFFMNSPPENTLIKNVGNQIGIEKRPFTLRAIYVISHVYT